MLSTLFLLASLASAPHVVRPLMTCAAVSKARVEAAVGRPLDAGEREETARESTCSWSGAGASVTVTVAGLAPGFNLSAELGTLESAFPGATLRPLAALGQNAYALEIAGMGTQIHLISEAGEYVLISVLGVREGHDGLAAAMDIARAALSR